MTRPLSLAAAVACFAAALPACAYAGTIAIKPPATAWILEEGAKVTISGTAEPGNDGSPTAHVTSLVQRGSTCAATAPSLGRSDFTVADFFGPDRAVMGPFSLTAPITLLGRGTLCAWLTEDGAQTVTVASSKLVPSFRVPSMPDGFPFFVSYPKRSDGGLTSYVSKKHRFTKFTAQCADRNGPHNRQRFTIVRSVTADPATGAFSVSGAATPDNSSNYDAPIPRPYHGRPRLQLSGGLYVARTNMQLRATYSLKGAGLHCSQVTVRGLGT
jgi:hypothetical protein